MSRQWTWRRVTARAVEVVRREGIRSLWFRILGETVYRRLLLMQLPLDEPLPSLSARLPVVVERLEESQIDEFLRFRPDADPSEVRRRVEAGHWCFVVRLDGRIVHGCWIGRGRAWIDYLGCDIELAPDEAYSYESFTAPDFRGWNFAPTRVMGTARFLREAGYRRLLAVMLPENAPAVRLLAKTGYRAFGVVGYVGIGRGRRHFRRVWQRAPGVSPAYWDDVLLETRRALPIEAWRGYMGRVYGRLVREWLPAHRGGRGLKTDLFEEAVSAHHLLPALGPGSVGFDCSVAVVRAARDRLAGARGRHLFVVGDLRGIPLRAGALGRILAGSSLDHFEDKSEIEVSLGELARVLAPGGVLVATFDNPHNPVIWLRNHLPFRWLNRLGLVPYYVGPTYGEAEARERVTKLGLIVTSVTAVAHAPRAPAIWMVRLAERLGWRWLARVAEGMLWRFEWLERWPTRFRTGYYLVLRAQKPPVLDRSPGPG